MLQLRLYPGTSELLAFLWDRRLGMWLGTAGSVCPYELGAVPETHHTRFPNKHQDYKPGGQLQSCDVPFSSGPCDWSSPTTQPLPNTHHLPLNLSIMSCKPTPIGITHGDRKLKSLSPVLPFWKPWPVCLDAKRWTCLSCVQTPIACLLILPLTHSVFHTCSCRPDAIPSPGKQPYHCCSPSLMK